MPIDRKVIQQLLPIWCTLITICIVWPQVWRVRGGRSVDGLSTLTMALAIFATFSWIGYGALRHDFAVLVTNLFVGAGQLIVVRALIHHRKLELHWVLSIALACSALILVASITDPAVVGISASLLGVLNLIPQVREALRSDRLEGISALSYGLLVVAVASWIGYAFARHDNVVLGANVLVLPLALVVLARILQTRKYALLESVVVDDSFAAAA